MKLKIYTAVDPKLVFEKVNFKVLNYIQHDFVRHRLGLCKDQANVLKGFATVNYFDHRL